MVDRSHSDRNTSAPFLIFRRQRNKLGTVSRNSADRRQQQVGLSLVQLRRAGTGGRDLSHWTTTGSMVVADAIKGGVVVLSSLALGAALLLSFISGDAVEVYLISLTAR